jgi:hypothetical protein
MNSIIRRIPSPMTNSKMSFIKPIVTRRMVRSFVIPDVVESLNTSSYFIGKGIILFTMFYCSMNWAYYRGMRKDLEKENEKKNEKKDKK